MRERRYEFSKETKIKAWHRCGGICECGCGVKITQGDGPEYHHRYLPATDPRSTTADNCQVLRKRCHRVVTDTETTPRRSKRKRTFEKRIGARDKGGGFRKPPPGYNPWTRRIESE